MIGGWTRCPAPAKGAAAWLGKLFGTATAIGMMPISIVEGEAVGGSLGRYVCPAAATWCR